jgi:hypothetical protein
VVRGLGLPIVIQVAAHALCREALAIEGAHRAHLMAGIAVYGRVRADQGKAVLMFVDVMDRHLPAAVTVAQVTLRSIFPPVNVGVAVLALLTDVGKGQVDVAILAGHFGVQPTQGKPGFAMIKFRRTADGRPARRGVAVLAGDLQVAMRTVRGGVSIRCLPVATRQHRLHNQNCIEQHPEPSQNQFSPIPWSIALALTKKARPPGAATRNIDDPCFAPAISELH